MQDIDTFNVSIYHAMSVLIIYIIDVDKSNSK